MGGAPRAVCHPVRSSIRRLCHAVAPRHFSATRTALSNSSIAPAPAMCHLDVATLRRFSPATAGTGGGAGAAARDSTKLVKVLP
jgi:hypothetical protein